MAMDCAKRFSLRDFGTLQFLWDALSGEYIQLYGPTASMNLSRPAMWSWCGDKPKLVELVDDEDEIGVTLDPEEIASVKVETGPLGDVTVSDSRDDSDHKSSLGAWTKNNKGKLHLRALKLSVEGFEDFEGWGHWELSPASCGDKPVSLWFDFKWLVNYVYGKKAVDNVWQSVKALRATLEKYELDDSHVIDSDRAREKKRRKTSRENLESSQPDSTPSSDWRVSALAAVLFLEEACFDKRWMRRKAIHPNALDRAQALLKCLMSWPLRGESSVAYVLDRSKSTLMLWGSKVDVETFKETEPAAAAAGEWKVSSIFGVEPEVDLFELLEERRSRLRNRSRQPQGLAKKLDNFVVDFAECVAELLETTGELDEWSTSQVLDLGILTTANGRCRNIPVGFKSAVIDVVRQNSGLDGQTIEGVVGGASRARQRKVADVLKRSHRFGYRQKRGRKGAFSRMAVKHATATAKSKSACGHPELKNFAKKTVNWERKHYYSIGEKLGRKQRRLSLAMDATDVSKRKVMNAAVCFPQRDLHMWLPPQDIGCPKGCTFHVAYMALLR